MPTVRETINMLKKQRKRGNKFVLKGRGNKNASLRPERGR